MALDSTRIASGHFTMLHGQRAVVPLDGTSGLPRDVLGNKGFGLDLMRSLGLPVPPAFCLTTNVCAAVLGGDEDILDQIWPDVLDKLRWLETETSRTFGRGPRPLLLSVRSGAAQSMPGMLDTVLNLGIDDTVYRALAAHFTPEFADDTRSRLRTTYARIVLSKDSPSDVPDDPLMQLRGAIRAVFASWNSSRAVAYRSHRGLVGGKGTAVVVQAMVFGNLGPDSGTGVLFSRNPATGENEPLGEWLPNAQGEDVVSGTFDCQPLDALRTTQPRLFHELIAAAGRLEQLGGDIQDIEFTVEEGRLWLLQTRAAKRSAQAAVRLALTFHGLGLIDDAEALRRVTPEQIQSLLSPTTQPATRLAATLLANGLPASPGVASGTAFTDIGAALEAADNDQDVILIRTSTSPDDVAGMLAVHGIVTEIGGTTSHAAVISREIGKPAVVGCGVGVASRLAGKVITIDGSLGEVREGAVELVAVSERDKPDLSDLADIARRVSPLRAHFTGTHPALSAASESAVRDALTAGHTDVICDNPLITMLTAIRLEHVPHDRLPPTAEHRLDQLTLLRAVGLKGRVRPTELAATVEGTVTEVEAAVAELAASGLLVEGNFVRLTPDGRVRLSELLADERRTVDEEEFTQLYDRFRRVNRDFKSLVSRWQLRNGQPNDHADAEYDAAVLADLDTIHQAVLPILDLARIQVPRISRYTDKLSAALARIVAGDAGWFARPLVDSYHTVWFELHEELIGAAGLTREDEARSGHAD